ncbi:MAG TPA: hypothetical protein VEB60_01110 [Candidatus Paceibacterota bacterium]|nr:hypothetical protein [Candidatus Paceibacterota bacterium]
MFFKKLKTAVLIAMMVYFAFVAIAFVGNFVLTGEFSLMLTPITRGYESRSLQADAIRLGTVVSLVAFFVTLDHLVRRPATKQDKA